MLGNAVNACGVWSVPGTSPQQLQILRRFPEPIPGTQYFECDDESEMREWGISAKDACVRFRAVLTQFIEAELSDAAVLGEGSGGRLAFIQSLQALL